MVLDVIFKVLQTILTVITVLTIYKTVYKVIGLFFKARVYPETQNRHKFAVIICARNEEKVIGNLLDSIAAQRYPKDKLRVFVIADNCTDATAAIAREKGATVYERHDPEHARKGWALGFGFDKIREEFGIDFVDGYMIFDADNLLHPDFVKEMNKAFDEGKLDVITGYRNTKNFDTNGISAAYGIHFYRSSLNWHRARQIFHTSTHLAGTGYVIRSKWLEDGWKWFCLTEDTQFTMHLVSSGMKVGYCEAAEFFLALNIKIQIPVRAEHKDRAFLLDGIPGQQQLLFPVQKGNASVSMSGDFQNFQTKISAAENVPLPQILYFDPAVQQVPVLLIQITAAEILQAAGVISVSVGQKHLNRKIRDLPHCLIHPAVLKSRINEQGLLLSHNQELPHPAILQDIKVIHKKLDFCHTCLLL